MNDVVLRIVASIVSACLIGAATAKGLGAMQQSGYKNGNFLRWLKRKDNLFYNRLSVLSLCLALASTVTALCLSFLGIREGLLLSAAPFFLLILCFCYADMRYALKVKTKKTGRLLRLFAVYILLMASVGYLFIALLYFLARWNGSDIYHLIAYAPFSLMPMLAPFLLCVANALTGVFENARNEKFVKRAGQVLDKSDMIRVGIVGSYGKTSVKNILKTLLLEKYDVVETPESYNTPIGIAKTVFSPAFENKKVFIAEMGARKSGDISKLCALVKPQYAVFTGVCAQHIQSFGSLENVWREKSAILRVDGVETVLGENLRPLASDYDGLQNVTFTGLTAAENIRLDAERTYFEFSLGGERIVVDTPLLGESAVENILLAATLAYKMGLTAAEIQKGVEKLSPVPHRLQLIKNGDVRILDDGYNANIRGAASALAALSRFSGRKCVVTPGIVECGVLEESINGELGALIASHAPDCVILVGETLVGSLKAGYVNAGGDENALTIVEDLSSAQAVLQKWIRGGDTVLFLNDLPDVF